MVNPNLVTTFEQMQQNHNVLIERLTVLIERLNPNENRQQQQQHHQEEPTGDTSLVGLSVRGGIDIHSNQILTHHRKLRTCRAAFHPICVRDSKHQMEIWGKSKNDSVEMRAFCSKNSTIVSPKVEPPVAIPQQDQNITPKKVPLLKFTRKNEDKNASASDELVNSISPKLVKKEIDIEQSKDANSNGDLDGTSLWMNSPDFGSSLRKLIDIGKITIGDLAAEVGISSESLEAALLGKTTTFSPGLKMRIVKWLQNNNVEKEELTNVSSDLQSPVVKSQPSRLRTKGRLMILKDDEEETDATDVVASSLTEDTKEDNITKLLSTSDPTSMKEEVLSKLIADQSDIRKNQPFDSQQNVVLIDGAVSMDHDLLKDEDANVTSRSLENGQCNNLDLDSSGFTSASYIHPLIRRKLMDLKDGNSNQQSREENSHGSDLSDAIEDELSKAKSSGILDLAPKDEVEGELVYLQSKLFDNSANFKQKCEDLLKKSICQVTSSYRVKLPYEIIENLARMHTVTSYPTICTSRTCSTCGTSISVMARIQAWGQASINRGSMTKTKPTRTRTRTRTRFKKRATANKNGTHLKMLCEAFPR